MVQEKVILEGITFDDVLLIPSKSHVLPRDVYKRQVTGWRTLRLAPMINFT